MKRQHKSIPILVAAVFLFAGAATALGQQDVAEEALITQAQIDLNWMRTTANALSDMLENARRMRDSKAINCIEERLLEIQEIIKKSDEAWRRLLEASARQEYQDLEKEAAIIAKNRKMVEELLKLVNECQAKIGRPGGFTEVTEESEADTEEGDPTKEEDREGTPDPLPPDYEPPQRPSPDED